MLSRFLVILFGYIIIFASYAQAADKTKFYLQPVNDVPTDSSFNTFYYDLISAIQKKDSEFIIKILSDDVVYSFGADHERKSATDGFVKHYDIKNEKTLKFWNDLEDAMKLGCTKTNETFVCPYVYSKWPVNFDSFSYIATTKEKATVRDKPESSAKVVRLASFEILKLANSPPILGWHPIELDDKKIGFIAKTDARRPTDYRVEFQKISKSWQMNYFISGD